jgi:hypothetical protein
MNKPVAFSRRAALVAFAVIGFTPRVHAQADAARIQRDIATLADDKWEGRQTCTAGNDSAAAYIARRFSSLRLVPAGDAAGREYFHRYVARPTGAEKRGLPVQCDTRNVAAILKGTDPVLAKEYVIIGAHYDHLGRSIEGAQDPNSLDSIRNGADDNASGTAGVMELARLFAAHPTKRSLLFVTFSGEEWGVLGSAKFADERLPAGHMQAMVNFDMIGRLRGDSVLVFGVGTATEMRGILESQNTPKPLALRFNPDGYGPSDHTSFYGHGIPVLHFFTREHEDYHKASDEAKKINAPGEARVLDYAARVIRELADRASPLTLVAQPKPAPMSGSGTQVYFGSIPDMAAGDVPGLRVSGVSPGSPADKAGLKPGDIVVELGGVAVTDLNTYSVALRAKKPGDTVTVVVLRDGKRLSLTATLGTR